LNGNGSIGFRESISPWERKKEMQFPYFKRIENPRNGILGQWIGFEREGHKTVHNGHDGKREKTGGEGRFIGWG